MQTILFTDIESSTRLWEEHPGENLAAIRASKEGGQRLTELQALTRLVTLRRGLGRSSDGSDELAALYHSVTEGLDEQPLIMARETLG